MIQLPEKLKKAIGSGVSNTLYPVLRIYKGVRIDQANQDFEGAASETINLSIKETSIKNSNGENEYYIPLLQNLD